MRDPKISKQKSGKEKKGTTLKTIYWVSFGALCLFILTMIAGLIVVVNDRKNVIVEGTLKEYLLFYFVIACLTFGLIVFLFGFKPFLLDFKDARTNHFYQITGTVVGFAKNRDVDTGKQENVIPLIKIEGTENILKLRINTYAHIGETYTFFYLGHTKLGEIISGGPHDKFHFPF